jgi:peptide/nickel transport system substrate-binding protein
MQYWYGLRMKPVAWLLPILAFTLVLAVACGSAAQTTDAEPAADNSGAAAPPAAAMTQPTAVPAAAPEQPAAMTDVHPGTVTWMIGGLGSENFDYAFDVGGSNNYIRFFGGFLLETNDTGELLPGIATEWGLANDARTWWVKIRDDVKFHDNTIVTAEDVLWTWQHMWNPESVEWTTQSGAHSRARIVEIIEQTALDTVSITIEIPDAGFDVGSFSAASPSPYVVLPKRDQLHEEVAVEAYARNPIGAGPMRLTKHIPAEVMQFERFDDYFYQSDNGFPEDRRVNFSNLDLRLVPEEATRVAAIRAGEADIAPTSLDAREQVEAGGGRLIFGREGIYFRIMLMGCMNDAAEPYPCDDIRFRQALDYALDKEIIRDQLYGGPEVMETKGWAATTPSTIGYSTELDPRPFDPDKARQLLADAGYPGGEGVGPLILNTWTSTAMPFLPESAQVAADFWRKELGLEVEVRVGDESTLKKATLAQELNGQILWRDNEARIDAASISRSSYGTPDHKGRRHNDAELFQAVQDALAETNKDARIAALNKMYQRLREETYELGIGYVNIPWAVSSRVEEWKPFSLAFYPSAIHTLTLKGQ